MPILKVRKLADKGEGERVVRFDSVTGEKKLVNPATPGEDHEPWPLAGVRIEDEIPTETTVSTQWVDRAVAEGWIERINEKGVVRPAGPNQNTWNSSNTGTPHTFIHCDEIIIKTVDGDVCYKVTHQPDKYVADGDDETPVTPEVYSAGNTRVDSFYGLKLSHSKSSALNGANA